MKDLLPELYSALSSDTVLLGIIPNISLEEFIKVFDHEESTVDWENFSLLIRTFDWRRVDAADLKKQIDQKYVEANRFLNTGNKAKAFQEIYDALRLETKAFHNEKGIEISTFAEPKKEIVRQDFFDFKTFQHGNNLNINQKILLYLLYYEYS